MAIHLNRLHSQPYLCLVCFFNFLLFVFVIIFFLLLFFPKYFIVTTAVLSFFYLSNQLILSWFIVTPFNSMKVSLWPQYRDFEWIARKLWKTSRFPKTLYWIYRIQVERNFVANANLSLRGAIPLCVWRCQESFINEFLFIFVTVSTKK